MKILLTGATGQVGSELVQLAAQRKLTLMGYSRSQLDITQPQQVTQTLTQSKPDIVVNAAAYTAVDLAEQEIALATAVNQHGCELLAQACATLEIPLIHLSTDYVFDGQQHQPYREDDLAAPINNYGLTKLAGEQAIRAICSNHIILRVSGVFGRYGHNFVKTILRLAREKSELSIVSDQILCPTPAAGIADTVIRCCEKLATNTWGTYHYCSSEPTSWYHFAEAIMQQARIYQDFPLQKIIPIVSSAYKTPAKRPAYSVLDCHKIQSQLNISLPNWQQALTQLIPELIR